MWSQFPEETRSGFVGNEYLCGGGVSPGGWRVGSVSGGISLLSGIDRGVAKSKGRGIIPRR